MVYRYVLCAVSSVNAILTFSVLSNLQTLVQIDAIKNASGR